ELVKKINEHRGQIKVNSDVKINDKGTTINGNKFDRILFTGASKEIDYLGAVCVVFTSIQSLSKFYWHNINDVKSPFLAFIQHTNMIDKKQYGGKHVYYMGTYVPNDGDLMKKSDERIKQEFFDYLKIIFPKFEEKEIEENWVFKFKNAQHIVRKNYKTPNTKLQKNIYVANFAQIYPEDRGTNFAVREGNKIADIIDANV
ncbi:MAG: amine oxidase, partial [uncultured bacterium]